jgi:hypothetical protein
MKRKRSRQLAVAIPLALLFSLGVTLAQGEDEKLKRSYEEGRRAAAEDIKHDRLVYHVGGLPAPYDELFSEILRKEFKVAVAHIGCVINTEEFQRGVGYNEVSVPEIERRYGEGILGRVEERAQKEYEERMKESRQDGSKPPR